MRLSGRGVRCVRGGREVFSGLDFAASAGEALAVTGRNGSGKTSLLRLIAGLLRPEGGSIDLEGGAGELTLPEQAHFLGHRDALKPALSVVENLAFWQQFLGGETFDIIGNVTLYFLLQNVLISSFVPGSCDPKLFAGIPTITSPLSLYFS